MQFSEDWSDVVLSRCSCDDTCESVLDPLKSVEVGTGHACDHGITVDKSRTHYCACNHVGGLSWHRRMHMTECVNVDVATSAHIVDKLVEGESLNEHHFKTRWCFKRAIGAQMMVMRWVETDWIFDDVLNKVDSDLSGFNPLTAASWESGYKFFVKWRRYPGARLERYLQNGAVMRSPARTLPAKWRRYPDDWLYTYCLKIENKYLFIIISMVFAINRI